MSDKRRKKQQKRAKRKGKVLAKKASARERMRQDEELVDEAVEALEPILPLTEAGGPLEAWRVPDALLVQAITACGAVAGSAQRKVARALAEDTAWLDAARAALERCRAERASELPAADQANDRDLRAFDEAHFWLAPAVTTLAVADQNSLLTVLYAYAANIAIVRGILPSTFIIDPEITRAEMRQDVRALHRIRGIHRADMGPLPAAAIDAVLPASAAWIEEVRGLAKAVEARRDRIGRAVKENATPAHLGELSTTFRSIAAERRAAGATLMAFDLERIADDLQDDTLVDEREESRAAAMLSSLYRSCLPERGADVDLDAFDEAMRGWTGFTDIEPPSPEQ